MVELLIRSVPRIGLTEPEEQLGGVFVRAWCEEGGKERGDKRERGGFERVVSQSSKEGISWSEIGEAGEERRKRTKRGVRGREEERSG
jgi:hypothetical protein